MVRNFANSGIYMQLYAPSALLSDGWKTGVLIDTDEHGLISRIEPALNAPDNAHRLPGPLLPGMFNLHSHAFQRAMAGLSERRGPAEDSFWTWRETMYEFVSRLTPDAIEAVAGQLYVEMLEAGYTGVAEFHYLHHDRDGKTYADIAETSNRIIAAARTAGIFLTHLPVLYMQGGFDGSELTPHQRRFANGREQFCELLHTLWQTHGATNQIRLGIALHSLRAIDPAAMLDVLAFLDTKDGAAPVHIHIAEQTREVEECIAWSGARPVQWLYDHAPVDTRWCLVHATHTDNKELGAMASSGAVAGLCPTTEANLGDGVFAAEKFLVLNGRLGIGSDSHVSVSPVEELRLLEYGQRLTTKRRAVLAAKSGDSVGRTLYEAAARGGGQASGVPAGVLSVGARADFIVLDTDTPALYGHEEDALLDALIFSGNRPAVGEVWVGGRAVVFEGKHPRRDEIFERYKRAVRGLHRA